MPKSQSTENAVPCIAHLSLDVSSLVFDYLLRIALNLATAVSRHCAGLDDCSIRSDVFPENAAG